MSKILITAGPTREFLDPVRFLSNRSSGRMGAAMAEALVVAGHEPVIVSGPVAIRYPNSARVISVVSTAEMLEAAAVEFDTAAGFIAVAAPCDYRPESISIDKLAKTGQPRTIVLCETADILATLAASKGPRFVVGFALETQDHHARAHRKLLSKGCDLICVNGPEAMDATDASVDVIDATGTVVRSARGSKTEVAAAIVQLIHARYFTGRRDGDS